MADTLLNWAGNLTYHAARVYFPETADQVQEIVRGSRKIRALGSRHSFNGIADTTMDLVSMSKLNRIISIDRAAGTVTVEGGCKYGDLSTALDAEGLAVHNLASLPHISIAGACATATHGSGVLNGNLATSVRGMEIVGPDGEAVEVSLEKTGESFRGLVVGLGATGIVTKVTLDVVPRFEMSQVVYENLPLKAAIDNFDAIVSAAYSVSLFTDWQGENFNQVWVKRRTSDGGAVSAQLYGAVPATRDMHPIGALSAENCTAQQDVPGPWYERLPHFKMGFVPSSGTELQTEYFVAREDATAALLAIAQLRADIAPLLLISEVRTIAADTLWMSMSYEQDSVALHFTWKQDWDAVRALLPRIEAALAPFAPRPHWGKLFTLSPDQVKEQYKRLSDFRALLDTYDPQGKFRNAFVDTYVF